MRVLDLVDDGDIVELDVEVLVDALERAADLDVVLELDGDRRVDERLEEAGVGGQYAFTTGYISSSFSPSISSKKLT